MSMLTGMLCIRPLILYAVQLSIHITHICICIGIVWVFNIYFTGKVWCLFGALSYTLFSPLSLYVHIDMYMYRNGVGIQYIYIYRYGVSILTGMLCIRRLIL